MAHYKILRDNSQRQELSDKNEEDMKLLGSSKKAR